MRAIVIHGKQDLRVEELPTPEPAAVAKVQPLYSRLLTEERRHPSARVEALQHHPGTGRVRRFTTRR